MEIYLPIAEMSVHWLVVLGLGGAVGFLSGMFGVSGGFLLTPMLIFYGIPAPVAVATTASHMTASSMSGVLTQWRRKAIDFKMAGVMLLGGFVGTGIGVWLFSLMRAQGQMDLVVGLSYAVLLSLIGGLMLNESVRTLYGARFGLSRPAGKALRHNWIHRLPFKARFRDSRLYISVLPPLAIGLGVGILSSIMGVGGGFMIVPAMIYLLRMPANMVTGTSLFQILVVTTMTTVLQSVNNFSVDIILALVLIVGGVAGAQLGIRAADKLRSEQLRLFLGLIVMAVALGVLWGLIARPDDLYTVSMDRP